MAVGPAVPSMRERVGRLVGGFAAEAAVKAPLVAS
jgi:hypothetical protein